MPQPPLIGAHQSIQGGHHRAVERGADVGCVCLQIFTRNNLRWTDRPLTSAGCRLFKTAVRKFDMGPVVAHNSYLINLASPDDALYEKSMDAFAEELDRCRRLGVRHIVAHPGAHTGAGASAGIERVVVGLNRLLRASRDVSILVETTAGAGSCLGGTFEEIAAILAGVRARTRVGVCFDTCHVFAAGYDLRTRRAYRDTMRRFDDLIGLERLQAFHFNDSKGDRGSHTDRHEQIGRGKLGREAFRLILRDRRFRGVPKLLETPKGKHGRATWDVTNLRLLRRLAAG